MSDVYYNPEKFGLTLIAEIDLDDESYQFNILAVWQHADGRLLTATDSGCSCPSPFEGYTSVDMLQPVKIEELENDLRNSAASLDDRDKFIRTVIEAAKNKTGR